MSTTTSAAYALLKGIATSNQPAGLTEGYRWENEDGEPLPDEPAPFAFGTFAVDRQQLIAVGGGLGQNLYRYRGYFTLYVFGPKNKGLTQTSDLAETLAAHYRSYRSGDVTVWSASALPGGDGAAIKPPGLSSEVGNYFFAVCEVELTFDQIG